MYFSISLLRSSLCFHFVTTVFTTLLTIIFILITRDSLYLVRFSHFSFRPLLFILRPFLSLFLSWNSQFFVSEIFDLLYSFTRDFSFIYIVISCFFFIFYFISIFHEAQVLLRKLGEVLYQLIH